MIVHGGGGGDNGVGSGDIGGGDGGNGDGGGDNGGGNGDGDKKHGERRGHVDNWWWETRRYRMKLSGNDPWIPARFESMLLPCGMGGRLSARPHQPLPLH